MKWGVVWVFAVFAGWATSGAAQATGDESGRRPQVFGGFSYLARNYSRGIQSGGMPGWEASLPVPLSQKSGWGFGMDGAGYYKGNPFGSNFDLTFVTAGPVYARGWEGKPCSERGRWELRT
ncbi:MAG TPA: hypothetical protein VFE06_02135 [Acidobacteriaceae bacterium]|jgi:hypothetical protein|nr:hypothetical protein [Acidobacteriaceae bacterium]